MGLLTIAGLTACGDKVTVPPAVTTTTPTSNVVRSVTVSPATATMNIGDKLTFVASVNADAGVTDRTVTWSSSDATIASVDANGLVTAIKAGNVSIIAKSKADATVQGAAAVTVAAGPGSGAPATVTISSINQTTAAGSVPANLGNVAGQLDVTLNVDAGGQKLSNVQLIMNCGGADTVVAQQTLSSASIAAEAASAPVTLSFSTAAFNSATGATAFKNGQCTLKAKATTTTGTTVASGSMNLTLNNADVVIGSVSSTKTAIRPSTGLAWNGGDVTVTVTPVMFSGRTPATTTVTLEGKTITLTGTGTQTATFTDGNGANAGGATDIDGITDPAAVVTFNLVDAAGAQFTTNPCGAATLCTSNSVLAGAAAGIGTFRLDTQKPAAGTFALANNADQNIGTVAYLGTGFRFASDSAAGYRGPNAVAGNQTFNNDFGGVDNVTVTFQTRTTGASSSTYTTRTSISGLTETQSTTGSGTSYQLRMVTTDALGNADTTTVGTFGVDITAPTVAVSGAADQATSSTLGGTGSIIFTISDNLSGPNSRQLVAQTSLTSSITSSTTMPAEGTIFSNGNENTAGPCVVGRWNSTQAAASADALPAYARDGTLMGYCSPTAYTLVSGTNVPANIPASLGTGNKEGYFTTRVIVSDVAGNKTASTTRTVAEDKTAPTVSSIDLPGSITGNSTASVSASVTDNVDIVGSYPVINYATPTNNGGVAINLQYATTAGPGVAFDNVLTRSATVSPSIPNFIKNLTVYAGGNVAAPSAGGNASGITITAMDEVNNMGSLSATFTNGLTLASGASSTYAAANAFSNFTILPSTATVSNCPAAGCAGGVAAANPTSTTLTITAQGPTSTFLNPFSGGAVEIWYQVTAGGNWFYAGNASTGVTRDNGGNRFWDYTYTFTPPKTAPDGTVLTAGTSVNLRAIGVNTNGDGLATAPTTITLTNP